jgi:hypothetical protein
LIKLAGKSIYIYLKGKKTARQQKN